MFSLETVIGFSNPLGQNSTVLRGRLSFLGEREFHADIAEEHLKPRLLTPADMQRYALRVAGRGERAEYWPEVQGFFVGWPDGSWEHAGACALAAGLSAAAAHAFAGAPAVALSLLGDLAPGHSASLLLQRLLVPEMRANLLAEHLCGNLAGPEAGGGDGPRAVLANPAFWGLPATDPREIYAGPSFYVHPAGLTHGRRALAVPFLTVGQEVILEAEPGNPHDPQAVHLWTAAGGDLGYLPRAVAATVAFHLRRGAAYRGRIALVRPNDAVAYRRLSLWIERG